MNKLKVFLERICFNCLKIFPVKKNRIYFVSNYGSNYSCNPRALFEYLYQHHQNEFDFYYCLNANKEVLPSGVKSAKYKSLKNLYYLCTANYIVNNSRFPLFFQKRKNQIYLQTWHGGPIPQKKIEGDAVESHSPTYLAAAKNDSRYIDYLLCGSNAIQNIFKSAFWLTEHGQVTNFGTPRYDKFFQKNNNLKMEILTKYAINQDSLIVLYAPTFRHNLSYQDYSLDNEVIINAFAQAYGKPVTLLYRFHPHLLGQTRNLIFANKNVINVTSYPDIIDLEIIADVLLTDFSSTLADFLVLNKPCYILAKNYDEYISSERTLYTKLEDLPYPVFYSEQDLAAFLTKATFNPDKVMQKVKQYADQIGLSEKGTACQTIYQDILKPQKESIR